ncbi:TonB family protein [Noviherbaspirillum sp.]|uniref:TonB family protein n=1 Tax=Noviherbaspirillum sp. TaxID=1926288 RepID=UPI002B49B996|nr:TonB family protein [Noviherbaspirillum sp.]
MSPRTRLGIGIAASLLVHGLILSMQFGVLGLGLPGLDLPWSERRVQAGLSVRLTDVKRTPEVQNTLASSSTSAPVESLAPAPDTSAGDKHMQVRIAPPPSVADAKPLTPTRKARRKARTPPRIAQSKPQRPRRAPDVIALNEAKPDSFVLPAPAVDEIVQPADTPEVPAAPAQEPLAASAANTPDEAPAAQAAQDLEAQQREADASRLLEEQQARQVAEEAARKAAEAEQRRAQEEAARRAEELEARRVEEARQQAMELEARRKAEQAAQQVEAVRRQEEARAMQQQLEVRRQAEEAALRKQEEQRVEEEAARRAELEAKKRDDEQRARREAMEREARLQAEEVARQQAEALARQKQAEQAALRQQAEAAAAQAREQERLAAENAAAARAAESARASAAAALPKAAGGGDLASRALDQARRPAPLHIEPRAPAPVADAAENPRRRSIFGGGNLDIGLMMYIESWRLKIERNGRLNYSQTAKDKARGDPIVTVSIRSDGSVEDVVINRSSGRPELDAAVRRIIKLNERYAAFPPNLARQYDVIDIRRVWNFDEVLRILEEVR